MTASSSGSSQSLSGPPPAATLPIVPRYTAAEYLTMCSAEAHEVCTRNNGHDGAHRSRFHSSRIPPVSIVDYYRRLDKYALCSAECHVIAQIYVERYAAETSIPLTFRNAHRIAIVSLMIAAKLRDDVFYSNAYYASIGGVTPQEINDLEVEFLVCIRWRTWVDPEEFAATTARYARRLNPLVGAA